MRADERLVSFGELEKELGVYERRLEGQDEALAELEERLQMLETYAKRETSARDKGHTRKLLTMAVEKLCADENGDGTLQGPKPDQAAAAGVCLSQTDVDSTEGVNLSSDDGEKNTLDNLREVKSSNGRLFGYRYLPAVVGHPQTQFKNLPRESPVCRTTLPKKGRAV
jgi:hypothetical protein